MKILNIRLFHSVKILVINYGIEIVSKKSVFVIKKPIQKGADNFFSCIFTTSIVSGG